MHQTRKGTGDHSPTVAFASSLVNCRLPRRKAQMSAKGWSSSPAHLKPSSRSVPEATSALQELAAATSEACPRLLGRPHLHFPSCCCSLVSDSHCLASLQAVPGALLGALLPFSHGNVDGQCLLQMALLWAIADPLVTALRISVSDSFSLLYPSDFPTMGA